MSKTLPKFFERDDNSRMIPGKKDAKKIEKGRLKIQKRILNDYLSNLYEKFTAEYPEDALSFSSFCRMRPPHILLVNFTTRNACLCTRHQNLSLKLKSLQALKVIETHNPFMFIKNNSDREIESKMQQIKDDKIAYNIWKKSQSSSVWNDVVKEKLKVVQEEEEKNAFVQAIKKEIAEFRLHVMRIKNQYTHLRHLKDNLPDGDVVIQMDFAEDYRCRSQQEVQSAYWSPEQVTIHPIVFYHKGNGNLLHKSMAVILDESKHDAGAIFAILYKAAWYYFEAYNRFLSSEYDASRYCCLEKTGCLITADASEEATTIPADVEMGIKDRQLQNDVSVNTEEDELLEVYDELTPYFEHKFVGEKYW